MLVFGNQALQPYRVGLRGTKPQDGSREITVATICEIFLAFAVCSF